MLIRDERKILVVNALHKLRALRDNLLSGDISLIDPRTWLDILVQDCMDVLQDEIFGEKTFQTCYDRLESNCKEICDFVMTFYVDNVLDGKLDISDMSTALAAHDALEAKLRE